MVKRIVALPGDLVGERRMLDDEYWVEGDLASASTDSRRFGPVARRGLKARVVLIYWPKERRRSL
jgi:type IV secretory pathway protease TraF